MKEVKAGMQEARLACFVSNADERLGLRQIVFTNRNSILKTRMTGEFGS